MPRQEGRPSVEEMLSRVRQEAGAGARGRHRVYLGIAPGVGKTVTALEELLRRKQRGTDAVIGFVETHGRRRTAELAHTNAPGSKHDKRWRDVEDLLEAGITVISTVNFRHLESLADIVENITGVQGRER